MSRDETSNPWTTLSSRPIYENPWIAVREDQVLRPDGSPGIYGVVHFENRAVGVLPVDDQGRIWLVGQFRYALGTYSWEIPEGGCLDGESTLAAAHRELAEETGLRAADVRPMLIAHLSNSVSDEHATIYRATGLTPGEARPEGTERLDVHRVDWATAVGMLDRGEITDSMSVMALLHEKVRRLAPGPIAP